jgi:hypothetical protein
LMNVDQPLAMHAVVNDSLERNAIMTRLIHSRIKIEVDKIWLQSSIPSPLDPPSPQMATLQPVSQFGCIYSAWTPFVKPFGSPNWWFGASGPCPAKPPGEKSGTSADSCVLLWLPSLPLTSPFTGWPVGTPSG